MGGPAGKMSSQENARDAAPLENLQGVLAANASAGALARGCFAAVSSFRHSSEPDESQYLHHLRIDVHDGDESSKYYC